MTKEEPIGKILQLYQDEKFRMDACFFCGFPSGTPNEKLVKVCEAHLNALDEGDFISYSEAGLKNGFGKGL